MKRKFTFGILILALTSLACRVSITPTPGPTRIPTITPTVTLTLLPTPTETPVPTPTPPLTSNSGPALMDLHMFTLTNGWGLTENQILITSDGGLHWAQVPLPGIAPNTPINGYFTHLKSAYFFVPSTDSQSGRFFSTLDGGATWQTATTPFKNAKIYFPNDNSGFALQTLNTTSDQMTIAIYQTLDQGKTWYEVFNQADGQSNDKNLPSAGIKTGLSFIDPSVGFIGLRDQKNNVGLYRTEDSGRTWVKQELVLPEDLDNNYQSTVWPPFFFTGNSDDGILPVDFATSASDASRRLFYSTNNAGLSWQKRGEIPNGTVYYFLDPQTGWAWGEHTLYSTVDGAKTWQANPVAFSRSERASIISFVDTKNGWIVTVDAKNVLRFYNTKDGGATWVAMGS